MIRTTLGDTWIDGEESGYTTFSGAPSGSRRRGCVRFPDGKLRIVRLGVADTFFTIPAKPSHGRIGFVSVFSDHGHEFQRQTDGRYAWIQVRLEVQAEFRFYPCNEGAPL